MAMKIGTAAFKERVSEGIDNEFMRGAVSGAQERLRTRRLQAAEELGNWEDWRSHAEEIRQHVLDNLDFYLEQLAENVASRGGHVFSPKRRKKRPPISAMSSGRKTLKNRKIQIHGDRRNQYERSA